MIFNPLLLKKIRSRGFIIFLLFLISLGLINPKEAKAQWVVVDPANLVQNTISAVANTFEAFGMQPIVASTQIANTAKEHILDSIAYLLAKSILRGITAQTVNWINSGFKGSPAFITNPERFFRDQADLQLEAILGDQLDGLCRPFQLQVRLALIKTYLQEARPPVCTFDKIRRNFENFGDDLTKGGWKDWFDYTQIDANNPYGAYYQARDFINVQIASNQQQETKQLDWGKGFLSFKRCKSKDPNRGSRRVNQFEANPNARSADQGQSDLDYGNPGRIDGSPYDADGNFVDSNPDLDQNATIDTSYDIYDPSEDYCPQEDQEILTPGSVIEGQLGKVLGSSIDQLELADEINEIVSALMNQMFKKAIGASINGLRGLSKKQATDKRSFLEEILSQDPSSASSQEDSKSLDRIDNSIPGGLDELIKPITTADGQTTVNVSDISRTRSSQYVNSNDIESMVDSEIERNRIKYNLSLSSGSQNNQNTTCNPDGTLSDGSGTTCTP